MKYKNIISLFVFVVVGLSGLVACSDDAEKATEWNATYVYLQRDNNLKPLAFRLTHTPLGVTVAGDPIECSFKVCLQKALDKDVTVTLRDSSKTIPAGNVILSAKEVTIKAGETQSGEITVSVTDLSFATDNKDAASYDLMVMLTGVETDAFNTQLSPLQGSFSLVINKGAIAYIKNGKPENASVIADRSGWKLDVVKAKDGQTIYNDPNQSVLDDNTNTYTFSYDGPFGLTVDFGSVKDVAGITVKGVFGDAGYSPTQIEILSSENGKDWVSQGALDVSGGTQDIAFFVPVKTQYLKYNMLKSGGTVGISVFNVYEANAK